MVHGNAGGTFRDNQEIVVLLVLHEQVLGVATGKLSLDMAAFLHREHRLVLQGLVNDGQFIEKGKKVIRRRGEITRHLRFRFRVFIDLPGKALLAGRQLIKVRRARTMSSLPLSPFMPVIHQS